MPRYSINSGVLGGASQGLSRLAAALVNGQQAEQAGANAENQYQSRMAQALASMRASDAAARYHDAQTEDLQAKQRVLDGRPQLYEEQVAATSGTTAPAVRAVRQAFATGQPAALEMDGPGTPEGGPNMAPIPAEMQTLIGRAMQQHLPLLANTGDLNPDQLANAAGKFRDMGLSDAIIGGKADRNTVAGAEAATSAKPLYHLDGSGATLDLYGGKVDTSNPMAGATIGLKNEQAGQAKAGAAEHYAGAKEKNARAAEIQAGQKNQLVQTDAGPIFANPATGQTVPIIGPDGKPVGGKGGSLNGEQANALTFATRMQAADKILADLAEKGVMRPSVGRQYGSSVPVVGGAVALAANAMSSPEQQQVEQAQRDFINAVLRRESGAAISVGEFANAAQQYFPQPGDSKQVIRQKAEARQRVTQGMLAAVPPNMRALPQLPGDPVGASPASDASGRPPLSSFNRRG